VSATNRVNVVARAESRPQRPESCAPVLNFAIGDAVVYSPHGVGRVEARGAVGGDLPEVVVLSFESGLRVTLPLAHARHALRSVSGESELEDVRRTLGSDAATADGPWSQRVRATREKLTAGHVTGLAEVVRDGVQQERRLAGGVRGAPAAAPSERQLYQQARKLLAEEVALARGVDAVDADTWIVAQIGELPETASESRQR
jgi:RNA polymerase-interacting CarD/CdnL/TRCF family regulator